MPDGLAKVCTEPPVIQGMPDRPVLGFGQPAWDGHRKVKLIDQNQLGHEASSLRKRSRENMQRRSWEQPPKRDRPRCRDGLASAKPPPHHAEAQTKNPASGARLARCGVLGVKSGSVTKRFASVNYDAFSGII